MEQITTTARDLWIVIKSPTELCSYLRPIEIYLAFTFMGKSRVRLINMICVTYEENVWCAWKPRVCGGAWKRKGKREAREAKLETSLGR